MRRSATYDATTSRSAGSSADDMQQPLHQIMEADRRPPPPPRERCRPAPLTLHQRARSTEDGSGRMTSGGSSGGGRAGQPTQLSWREGSMQMPLSAGIASASTLA